VILKEVKAGRDLRAPLTCASGCHGSWLKGGQDLGTARLRKGL